MYENIPSELRSLRQWCLWKYEYVQGSEKPTKVPYQPNGRHASVNDPSSYSSFDECIIRLRADDRYSGLGFIFTVSDPYAGIDLDNSTSNNLALNKQIEIFNKLNSYSEKSPSGLGVHIIVKGSVPTGIKTSLCEIYSSGRFFTFTGNVCNAAPIEDRQELLTQLWNEIKKPENTNESIYATTDEPEKYTDDEILEMASTAENGEKCIQLLAGNWKSLYSSQSEADFAFINILAFYTKNRTQITRIFHKSKLGARPKAKRLDYLVRMINRSFDNVLPMINIEGFKEALDNKLASVAQLAEPAAHNSVDLGSNPSTSTNIPPGLIGDLAHYIYNSAPHPVWEIALAGAIGFMAGVCGKAYNCNGNTLNLYLLIVGDTGIGKEAPRTAISKLINEIDGSLITPLAKSFFGPQRIASGQALNNYVKDNSSFISFLGEFGLRIQSICDSKASSAERGLYDSLLDLFSVGTGMLGENIYADKTKSSAAVHGHAMSILGDTTPDTFYSMIDENMIASGLLPRFLIFEYKGKRSYFNRNKVEMPTKQLVESVTSLISNVKTKIHEKITVDVQITDEANSALWKISDDATDKINDSSKDMYKSLWNRAHLKIQRLASLVAIGINPYMPTLDYDCVDWAARIVYHDIEVLLRKFESGDVGKNSEELKQFEEIRRCIKDFAKNDWPKVKPYCPDGEQFHKDKIIPSQYFSTKVSRLAIFKNDKLGSKKALERAIKEAIDFGLIVVVSAKYKERYNTTRNLYAITPEALS